MPDVAGDRDATWEEIRGASKDRASGAADIARRAAAALASLPRTDLEAAVQSLVEGHPSMAPLWRLGSAALAAEDHARAAIDFAEAIVAERDAVGRVAAGVLRGPVVTHSYSSSVVAAVATAGVPALCARSEPGGEGAVTAERLRERGAKAEVVSDREAVRAAADGRAIVTGADAVGPGGVVNKVGTRALAEAAAAGGGDRYAVAGRSKLLAQDLPTPLPFERTSLDLFTGILTEEGMLKPEEAGRAASAHSLHPALRHLLARLG
jgi:translation initiation factor 2B subunit (eIF-2B alpha/beta/delta family)